MEKQTRQQPPGILSLAEKVAFLKQTAIYPFHPENVETRETHMSWVFLANGYAYKLKKPVKYRFLDFRILDSRLRNCREEVQLNKRLAPHIYLGMVPLAITNKGSLVLEGKGKIVDWLVKMKRIPEEDMLSYAISHHTVDQSRLKKAAHLLTAFYKKAPAVITDPTLYITRLKGDIQVIYRELINPAYRFPPAQVERLTTVLLQFLTIGAALITKRVTAGKIIEAHGDLRPEHICVGPEPAIIDCLEFNRELRILDTAEELSFLAMEGEIMKNPSIGKIFFDTYTSLTSDQVPAEVINFYKLKKACLRAYLVARHITEEAYKSDPQWLSKANAYLQLAGQYSNY
jgi:aminoglycoside phosphotransferase family enzyme